MKEKAATWQRVSSRTQGEENQRPDLTRWCDGHEYEVTARYVIKASAYKGKHQAMLDQAFADMAAGKYTVLVVWKQDRIERRGMEAALLLVSRAKQAGGRIEFVTQPHLNKLNDMGGRISYAVMAEVAQAESETKSDRILAKQAGLRASGSVVGRPAWGYRITCRDFPECAGGKCGHIKIFAPTAEGRKYIPLIFQMVIDGKSLREIAAWLDAEGVKPMSGKPWNEFYLGTRLIKNPTYYGQRPNAGLLETEALVSATTWQEANAALASRARRGRGTVAREKTMLSVACGACYGVSRDGCQPGVSPMYRVLTGKGKHRKPYYRCTGQGPQRKGCGAAMIPVDELDKLVTEAMLNNQMWHFGRVFVPGDDRSDDIARLRERGADAIRKGDYKTAAEAMQEAGRLESLPRVAPHWKSEYTDQTEAQYFASLDAAGRREYLSRHEITARRQGDGRIEFTIVPKWAAERDEAS